MYIDGHINIWFDKNSLFKMEFSKVSVHEALALLHLIRMNLKSVTEVQDEPLTEVYRDEPETGEGGL